MNSDELFEINDSVIEKVEHIKYLGFVIDKKLNLNEHINYTCKKIGFLKRIRKTKMKKDDTPKYLYGQFKYECGRKECCDFRIL